MILMHRLGRTVVRAASLLTTLALIAAVPAALAAFIGWPLPRHLPAGWAGWAHILTGSFPDQAVTGLLAIALWLVWAAFCYTLVGELIAARKGRIPRPIRGMSPLQSLAALLVAGMSAGPIAATSAALIVPPAVVSTWTPPPAAAVAHQRTVGLLPGSTVPQLAVATAGSSTPTATAAIALPPSAAPATAVPRFALAAQTGPLTVVLGGEHYTITVHHGDTLWDLAGAWLGDPHRWPEIYHLNAGRYDEHGRMHHGHHIEADWVLTLPDDARPPHGTPPVSRPHTAPTKPGAPSGTTTQPAPSGTPTKPATTTPPAPTATATVSPQTSTAPEATTSTTPADPGGAVTPSATPASPSAAPSATEPTPAQSPTAQPQQPHGITLPGDSWLDLGLAAAIAAAAALVWKHRRHRYQRRPLSAELRLNDPDMAPLPPVADQIRRHLRHSTANPAGSGADTAELPLLPTAAATGSEAREFTGSDADEWRDDGHEAEPPHQHDDADEQDDDEYPGEAAVPAPRPAVPSLAHPLAAVWPPAGLGLVGPGAEAAARGFLTAALAAGGVDEPDERSWVVMPSAIAATLLGASAVTVPHTPRLTVTGGLDDALDLLETQSLYRSRIVYAHEVDTVAELRAADPAEEPMPPMMLLADAATRHQRTRIAALLTQGQRLDVHGVLLGSWPDGNTIEVAADGTTAPADNDGSRHGPHPADVGRLAVLTAAETIDLLKTLAESHTGQPQAPAPAEPAASTIRHNDVAPAADEFGDEPAPTLTEPAATAAAHGANPLIENTAPGTLDPSVLSGDGEPQPELAQSPPRNAAPQTTGSELAGAAADGEDTGGHPTNGLEGAGEGAEAETTGIGRAEITVLGPVSVLGLPAGIAPRKKSLELLVYLAVHDGDATAEAILDDVLGDVPASKAPGRLYTYVSDLRTVLRRTAGRGTYLSHPGQRYVLNRDLVDIDLWRMQQAIRDAALATLTTDAADRQTALRRAVDTYSGLLAEGADYEWIEPYREAVRQQALDAHLALAELLSDSPADQITVLDAAIRHNPYAEQLYQQAMTTRANLGHLDAIRTLRRALTRALDDIDAEPTDETTTLADQLVKQLQRTGRPEPRRAPQPGDGAAA